MSSYGCVKYLGAVVYITLTHSGELLEVVLHGVLRHSGQLLDVSVEGLDPGLVALHLLVVEQLAGGRVDGQLHLRRGAAIDEGLGGRLKLM